jgi:hypothetical protein
MVEDRKLSWSILLRSTNIALIVIARCDGWGRVQRRRVRLATVLLRKIEKMVALNSKAPSDSSSVAPARTTAIFRWCDEAPSGTNCLAARYDASRTATRNLTPEQVSFAAAATLSGRCGGAKAKSPPAFLSHRASLLPC